MYPIVRKEVLADQIVLMEVKAPMVARKCLPGQFIIAKTDEIGERIPLTICDYDRAKETVTIVVQTIGAGTMRMMDLNVGDELMDFVGPLGCASELCEEKNLEETKQKKILFVAGGLGIAPVYPQVKWLHEHGVEVDVIMGCRNKDLLFYIDEMKAVAKTVYVATDDGSYGFHGNGCAQLQALYVEGVSTYKMSKELEKRGYNFKLSSIRHLLANENYYNGLYPMIISKEIWDRKCEVARNNDKAVDKSKSNIYFGAKL